MNGNDVLKLAQRIDRSIEIIRKEIEPLDGGLLYSVFLALLVNMISDRLDKRMETVKETHAEHAAKRKETLH